MFPFGGPVTVNDPALAVKTNPTPRCSVLNA